MSKSKKIYFVTLVMIFILAFSVNVSAFTVKRTQVSYPKQLKVGSSFTVKGELSSSEKIARVVVSILKDNTQIQRYEAKPNSTYYNLSKADSYIIFDNLAAGTYTYRVSAFNKSNTKFAVVNKKFTVGTTSSSSKITISSPSPAKDFSIIKGNGMVVAGNITSTYTIKSITAKILNGSNKVLQSKTVKPGTKTYNMTTNKTIDNAMQFDKLSAGSYKFQVTVTDSKGTSKNVINRKFTVKVSNVSSTGTGSGSGGTGSYSNTTATVSAPSGFTARTTRPAASNKYYYNKNYNIYYGYDSLAPTGKYYSGGYVLGNCTWYACGRAMEIAAKNGGSSAVAKVQAIFGGDPVGIFNTNKKLGKFKYGSSPKPGSIAVFNYGGNSGDAHVAIVEKVINGVPYVSESGYTVSTTRPNDAKSNIVFWYQSIYAWSGGRQLLGYIYLI